MQTCGRPLLKTACPLQNFDLVAVGVGDEEELRHRHTLVLEIDQLARPKARRRQTRVFGFIAANPPLAVRALQAGLARSADGNPRALGDWAAAVGQDMVHPMISAMTSSRRS